MFLNVGQHLPCVSAFITWQTRTLAKLNKQISIQFLCGLVLVTTSVLNLSGQAILNLACGLVPHTFPSSHLFVHFAYVPQGLKILLKSDLINRGDPTYEVWKGRSNASVAVFPGALPLKQCSLALLGLAGPCCSSYWDLFYV